MDYSSTTIDIIRHGEPKGGEKFRGSLDDPLSSLGWSQMHDTIGNHSHWQHIITSPLSRCHDFAEKLADKTQTPLTVEPGFREIHFGDWEGKKAIDIDAHRLKQFWYDPIKHPAPNGESLTFFQKRVLSAWDSTVKQHQNQKLLLVTHGGTIRILIAKVLHIPLNYLFNMQVPYAAISRIIIFHHDNQSLANIAFINGQLSSDKAKRSQTDRNKESLGDSNHDKET